MWLLTLYSADKELEFLFDNEQEVKEYIKKIKPTQFKARFIKRYHE